MTKAYAPTGSEIVGAFEYVPCTVGIAFARAADGAVAIEYDGTGSSMHWDDQVAAKRNGEPLYVDDSGGKWTLSQLTFKDVGEEGDGDETVDDAA